MSNNNELIEMLKQVLKEELKPIREDIQGLKGQVSENTSILKALEHKTDVIKAEQEKMSNDMAHMQGDLKALSKDVNNLEIITSSNWNDIAKLKAVK
ncbi:hypothetical protein [Clostridium ljungdahlii]|uniref:Uncharacterized protein n=1 Tax=Clostridium ljungdahlii TaxID=1538 RepID=A0A166RKK9_9CLOT|nr:hypothetical protein [Clostridium ljungdahlii]OAA90873.1 hypothetical protein WY13_00939 [Clostridium ljungdahlii]